MAAYGYTEGGRHTMVFPNLGAFAFAGTAGSPVEAEILPHVDDDVAMDSFRRMVVPMVLQTRGLEILHSSAVVAGRSVLAFCGTSHSGKSTLAYGLSRRGPVLWADDSVAFELTPGAVSALPLPSRIRLRPESEDYFRSTDEPAQLEAAREVRVRRHSPAPLGGIFMLEREATSTEPSIRPMTPDEAFPLALTHAFCFSLDDPARKRAMVRNYLELVRRVPVHEVRLPVGLAHLERTLDLLEAAGTGVIEGSPAPPQG